MRIFFANPPIALLKGYLTIRKFPTFFPLHNDYWRMGLPLEIIVVAVGVPAIMIFCQI